MCFPGAGLGLDMSEAEQSAKKASDAAAKVAKKAAQAAAEADRSAACVVLAVRLAREKALKALFNIRGVRIEKIMEDEK